MATVTGLCDNCDPPYAILNYDHDFIPTPEEDFVSNIGIYVFEHKNWFRQSDLDLDSCADEMSQWLAVNKGGL